jgi:predicted ATPase
VLALAFAAWALWCLGYPDQALQRSHAALALGQEVVHPHSLAQALDHSATLHQWRGEISAMQERVEAGMALAVEQEFAQWLAVGMLKRGWILVAQGQREEGLAHMHQGIETYRATGAELGLPYWSSLLATAYGQVGQPAAGLQVLAEARTRAEKTAERWYEAELYRLQGELLLVQSVDHHTAADTCFQQALTVARRQQAKSWELRAATSLSRLWQQQDKRAEARALLAPIYGWFTEGFDTVDLREAKALLEALA